MKKIFLSVMIPLVLLLLSVSIYGECAKNPPLFIKYLSIPFSNILSICVAVFISYFLTQRKSDERKFVDTSLMIIERLFSILSNPRLYTITIDEDITFIKISQKRIDNGLSVLANNLKDSEMLSKVTYTKQQLDTYWEHISNHITDFNHLQKSQPELLNHISNMEGKLSELMFDLNKN